MNKRARLARRILRDHRTIMGLHWEKARAGFRLWHCPHCVHPRPIGRIPRAYR